MLALVAVSLLFVQQPAPTPPGPPKIDTWSAWVNLMPVVPKGGPFLIVRGEVEAPEGYTAVLEVVNPQGFKKKTSPKILLLNLKFVKLPKDIERKGPRADVMFRHTYSREWESVQIFYPNRKSVTLPIGKVH
jgi:hypothetical protein